MRGQVTFGVSPRPACEGGSGEFCCWGFGEFGQNCHGGSTGKDNVRLEDGNVEKFSSIGGERIKLMSCGASHTLVVTNENVIYSWGNGYSGQLGCGDLSTKWEPTEVELEDEGRRPVVGGVATGGRHSFLWLENGHVHSWGNNFYAQLGYDFQVPNYKENQVKPHLLQTLTYRPVMEISCGQKHTVLLFKDGTVAAMGNNANGQIGDGTREEAVVPKKLDYLPKVKHVTAGSNHNIAVTEDGRIYVWGQGKGCGKRTGDVLEAVPLPLRSPVKQVAAGQFHSLALTSVVYSWGYGTGGQLGHGDTISYLEKPRRIRQKILPRPVVQVACGENYAAAVTASGGLYMWGKSSHVIVEDSPSTHVVPYPVRVNPVHQPVSRISCGAWHAAVISGIPVTDEAMVRSLTTAEEQDIYNDETGVASGTLGDRCIQTTPQSRSQSDVSLVSEVSDASSLSEDDSLDDSHQVLQDLLKPSLDYPTSSPEGAIRGMNLADFYAPTPSPLAHMAGASIRQPSEAMEGIPQQTKKSVAAFSGDGSVQWRPSFPSLSNGQHADSDPKDGHPVINQALSSSRTSLNTTDPSGTRNIPSYSRPSNGDHPGGGGVSTNTDNPETSNGEIYTSSLNQGIVQFSKSRSVNFVLPREKSGFHSQNLDKTTTLPSAQPAEPNPSPRHRFHIDQHVSLHLRTAPSTTSSKSSSIGNGTVHLPSNGNHHEHGSNSRQTRNFQAPHVALRRSKTVYGMHKSPAWYNKLKRSPSEDRIQDTVAPKESGQEFALMMPRTVTFMASDGSGDGHVPNRINLSNKLLGNRRSVGVGLGFMSEKTLLDRKSQKPNNMRKIGGYTGENGSSSVSGKHGRNHGSNGWTAATKISSFSASNLEGVHLQGQGEGSMMAENTVAGSNVKHKETLGLYMKPPRTMRKERPSRR